MKLYLASFLEPENFGPGQIIGICQGEKPKHLEVDKNFTNLTPRQDILDEYNTNRFIDRRAAGKAFEEKFSAQLNDFVERVQTHCLSENKSPEEVLPFQDGDTLCSWERSFFANYRGTVAEALKKLGYEISAK